MCVKLEARPGELLGWGCLVLPGFLRELVQLLGVILNLKAGCLRTFVPENR